MDLPLIVANRRLPPARRNGNGEVVDVVYLQGLLQDGVQVDLPKHPHVAVLADCYEEPAVGGIGHIEQLFVRVFGLTEYRAEDSVEFVERVVGAREGDHFLIGVEIEVVEVLAGPLWAF